MKHHKHHNTCHNILGQRLCVSEPTVQTLKLKESFLASGDAVILLKLSSVSSNL